MLVVLDNGSSCPVACAASPWRQMLARARASRIDRDLAAGASPDATVELALRAQVLVGTRARTNIARGAQRILDAASGGSVTAPICRDRVRACAGEISELISRLRAPGPVSAMGMAQAMALVTDARSPLFYRASPVDLRAAVRSAADALSPL